MMHGCNANPWQAQAEWRIEGQQGVYRPVSKKSNRHTNKHENICLACCMGAPGEKWNVKQRWQEAKGGPKSEAGSEIALIQNSSNMAVVAGPGRQAPRAGGERVGRSRERKAKWWRRAVRSTASETLLFQSEG